VDDDVEFDERGSRMDDIVEDDEDEHEVGDVMLSVEEIQF